MSLFSSNKSSTNYSTTNTFTDNSASAAQGAVAVGAGANVNITDAGATKAALEANKEVSLGALVVNRDVAGMALDTTARVSSRALDRTADVAGMALEANRDVNIKSLDTTARLAQSAINTVVGLGEVASRERIGTLETTNLALRNQQGTSDKLASLAGAALERSQTPDSGVTKTMLYVIGAVVAFLALAQMGRNRRPA